MNARQLDEATTRLHDLRAQSVGDFVLAVAATGLALTATQLRPVLAIPFLVGAVGVGFLGVQAYVRRIFLVEELADDRDAYAIPAVRRFGERAMTLGHRHRLAQSIRVAMTDSSAEMTARLQMVRVELDQLVAVLEDEQRSLEPYSLVALEHWLNDPGGSFRNPLVPAVELRSRLRRVIVDFDERPARERGSRSSLSGSGDAAV
jgi:hypothetical protein